MTTLATAPSGGIPVGYRKKIAADIGKDAKKHAAGIVFVAPDGDILMLRRSNREKNYAGYWSLPGGGGEEGESPEETALREAGEEMAGLEGAGEMGGDSSLKPLDRKVTPTGMVFHTFAAPVPSKFTPKLNDEHSGFAWASLDMLPRPMHPAVEETLREQVGTAADAQGWDEVRNGFLKWTQEEQSEDFSFDEVKHDPNDGRFTSGGGSSSSKSDDEPKKVGTTEITAKLPFVNEFMKTHQTMAAQKSYLEKQPPEKLKKALELIEKHGAIDPASRHVKQMIGQVLGKNSAATDSALRLALDRASVREYTRDGHLKVVRTHISKANVCPYKGSEIPGYDELGLDPTKIYQLLRDPEELAKAAPSLNGVPLLRIHKPVNSTDHPKVDTVGAVGTSAEFDGEYLDNAIVVWTQDDIDAVDSNEKRDLSAGYHYTPDMTPGNFRGKAFDGVMRDIEFNHVAIVESGRAGPDVVVGDSTENLPMKATRFGALALSLTAAHVAPLLAMDAKGVMLPKDLFRGITPKNFKDKKIELLSGVKLAVDGKLRKGLAYDEAPLMRLLDALQDTAAGEPVSEEVEEKLEEEIEEAATVEPVGVLPAPVAEKTKAFDAEPVKQFCREKGMSEDDITALSGMFPKPATDEFPPKKGGEEDDDEEAKKKKADEDKAKDAAMKDMVTKPAMDAAIKSATEATAKSVRENERAIAKAREDVEPWVGKLPLSLAMDTAADVYRHAATMLNVTDAKTLHADALFPIIRSQRKPGARAAETHDAPLGMDAAAVKGFSERFPDAGRIQPA